MKLVLVAAAFAAVFPMAAYAAAPATDHSQHEQHQQQPAPRGQTPTTPAAPSTTPPAHQHGGMGKGMHQDMKMDGCCCCKEDQQAPKPCCDKDAPQPGQQQGHDHDH